MSFCTNCGYRINHGEVFCSNCGKKIDDIINKTKLIDENEVVNTIMNIKTKVDKFNSNGTDNFKMLNNIDKKALNKFVKVIQRNLGIIIDPTLVIAHMEKAILLKGKEGFIILEDGIVQLIKGRHNGFYKFKDCIEVPRIEIVNEGTVISSGIITLTTQNDSTQILLVPSEMSIQVHELIQVLYYRAKNS